MTLVVVIITLALIAAVVLVVSVPLRAARPGPGAASAKRMPDRESAERAELEVAREAKYREIRDAELDYRTGKLSREDYEAVDGALRSEAVEILDRLEASEGGRIRPRAS
jgi:hypothetical protein